MKTAPKEPEITQHENGWNVVYFIDGMEVDEDTFRVRTVGYGGGGAPCDGTTTVTGGNGRIE